MEPLEKLEIERETSQKREPQREKTPLNPWLTLAWVLAPRRKHSWKTENAEQRFLQLLGIEETDFLVQISSSWSSL